MLVLHQSRFQLAALGLVLGASGLGLLPVGKFVGLGGSRGCTPAPQTPTRPPEAPRVPLPPALAVDASPSRGAQKAGPITVEAMLGQSRLERNADGTLFLDVKLSAAEGKDAAVRRPVDLALVLDVSGSMADQNKITLLREACQRLAGELGPEDRIAVVSFSTEARTLFPLQGLVSPSSDRDEAVRPVGGPPSARYLSAVSELVPEGSTNLSAGIEAGAAELRRSIRQGAARRLLVLTDGIANAGVSRPEGLRALVSRLAGEGFSVSTVGLGLDVNGGLLGAISDVGGGHYHYVDSGERIAGIYAAELRGMRALAVKGARLTLTPAPGVVVEEVVGWASDTTSSGVIVNVGDLEGGRSTKVVARLRVPTGAAVTAQEVVSVAFRAEAVSNAEELAPAALALGVQLTESKVEAQASVASDAQKDLLDARIASDLRRAQAFSERGDYKNAQETLDKLRDATKTDELSFRAADGKEEKVSLKKLADTFASPSAPAAQKAQASRFSEAMAGACGK